MINYILVEKLIQYSDCMICYQLTRSFQTTRGRSLDLLHRVLVDWETAVASEPDQQVSCEGKLMKFDSSPLKSGVFCMIKLL